MKSFCKKNKYTIIVVVCFIIFVILLVQVKNIFFPNVGSAIYGSRLDGIEAVAIKAQKQEAIENAIQEDAAVSKVNVFVKGRILNVLVTLNDDASKDAGKALTSKILDNLEEEQKKYFDIQKND